ncbi:hypothetical protein PIB30_062660 [Stylosanthes scabra]|uniref:Uncharacterized protein n=1 Tax=Stylosanthes scabra TaxID=79078 RepID=A0ABU6QLK0_9FABA|nr:hypothetical protein [Stylosanthes scabra]
MEVVEGKLMPMLPYDNANLMEDLIDVINFCWDGDRQKDHLLELYYIINTHAMQRRLHVLRLPRWRRFCALRLHLKGANQFHVSMGEAPAVFPPLPGWRPLQ